MFDYNSAGYVYFARREDGLIKIGGSTFPKERTKQVQSKCGQKTTLLHTIFSDKVHNAERAFHRMFESKKVKSEWYALSDQDMADVMQITEYFAADKQIYRQLRKVADALRAVGIDDRHPQRQPLPADQVAGRT